jgi:hypothetical protein
MTLDPQIETLIAAGPKVSLVETLRRDALAFGMVEALLEDARADMVAKVDRRRRGGSLRSPLDGDRLAERLREQNEQAVDAALGRFGVTVAMRDEHERRFERAKVEAGDDENLLAELEQERQRGHADGLRWLTGKDDRA